MLYLPSWTGLRSPQHRTRGLPPASLRPSEDGPHLGAGASEGSPTGLACSKPAPRWEVPHRWVPATAQLFPTSMALPPVSDRGSAMGPVTVQQVTAGHTSYWGHPATLTSSCFYSLSWPYPVLEIRAFLGSLALASRSAGQEERGSLLGVRRTPWPGPRGVDSSIPQPSMCVERRGGNLLPRRAPRPCWNLPAHPDAAGPPRGPELVSCPRRIGAHGGDPRATFLSWFLNLLCSC